MKPRPSQSYCLRCSADFEQVKRQASYFCPDCRVQRRREYEAGRKRRQRSLARDIRLDPGTYQHSYASHSDDDDTIEALMGIDQDRAFMTFDEFADSVPGDEPIPLVADWNTLEGANTPAGPPIGVSTYWEDFAAWLDDHHIQVATHPWFGWHPHWHYSMNDREAAQEYLEAA